MNDDRPTEDQPREPMICGYCGRPTGNIGWEEPRPPTVPKVLLAIPMCVACSQQYSDRLLIPQGTSQGVTSRQHRSKPDNRRAVDFNVFRESVSEATRSRGGSICLLGDESSKAARVPKWATETDPAARERGCRAWLASKDRSEKRQRVRIVAPDQHARYLDTDEAERGTSWAWQPDEEARRPRRRIRRDKAAPKMAGPSRTDEALKGDRALQDFDAACADLAGERSEAWRAWNHADPGFLRAGLADAHRDAMDRLEEDGNLDHTRSRVVREDQAQNLVGWTTGVGECSARASWGDRWIPPEKDEKHAHDCRECRSKLARLGLPCDSVGPALPGDER